MGLFRKKSIKEDKESQFRASQNRLGKSFLDSLEEIRRIPIDAALKLVQKFQSRQIELKKQNEEFREIRDELKKLFDKFYGLYEFAPVGYFTLDEDGTISETNLTGAEMLGCERAYLIGKELAQFIVSECLAEYLDHCKLSFETKARQTCQLKIERRDGDFFFAHLESIPVKDSQGNYSQLRTAVCDISSRKQIEEALRDAHDILEKQVQQRTTELVGANEKLRQEIVYLIKRCLASGCILQKTGCFFTPIALNQITNGTISRFL
jgi:PAS domain S-box-containing protein